ncbi:MAG: ABC transporter permease [Syntrophobacteraceae bacterium]
MGRSIERHRYILDFTLSSLSRRKGRNASLLFVYTLVVFMLASVVFFTHAIKREGTISLKNAPDMIIQRSIAGRRDLIPVGYLDKIRKIRGVSSARSRLWGNYYDPSNGANYTVMVPEKFKYGPGNIVIGKGISRARLLYPGDYLGFSACDGSMVMLQIRDLFSSASELVSSDLVSMSEADFRKIFGIPENEASDIAVRVRNPLELSTVAGKVSERFPDTRVVLREDILRTYDSIFNWRSGMMVFFLSAMLLAFLIFAWDKASGLSQEEKREIGILKAIGWETSDVILMKFWEGLVISLSAFLAGTILAFCHVFFSHSFLFEPALKGWAVLYPEFTLIPFIDPFQVATIFFLSVVPYTVATIIPSWAAAVIDPDTVMRA